RPGLAGRRTLGGARLSCQDSPKNVRRHDPAESLSMRVTPLLLMMAPWLAVQPLTGSAAEEIFVPAAKLRVEAEGGVGGEGPAWHPQLGLLSSGNDDICQLDRTGKSRVYRAKAGTNGLLFDAQGRLLACEPKLRRITRTEPDGKITVLAERYKGQRFN